MKALTITCFPYSLCLGDPLRSAGCPLLSPWEWVYHPSSVSLHYSCRGSIRYEISTQRRAHTHTVHHMLLILYSLINHPYPCAIAQLWTIQPNCSAVRASSLSPCSSRHLASYCLIYLRFSVIGQWESIVLLNLSFSPTDFTCHLFDANLSLFFSQPFTFVSLPCAHLFSYVLSFCVIFLNSFFYLLTHLPLTPIKNVLTGVSIPLSPNLIYFPFFSVSISFIIYIYFMSVSQFCLFFLLVCVPLHSRVIPISSNSM